MTRGLKPTKIVPCSSRLTKVPAAPADLSPDAKVEWKRVAPILIEERDVLSSADLGVLKTYVIHFAIVQEAQRCLNMQGLVLDNGKRNPAYGMLKESSLLQLRAAGELGLTPYSRSRAAMVGGSDDEPSPLDL